MDEWCEGITKILRGEGGGKEGEGGRGERGMERERKGI